MPIPHLPGRKAIVALTLVGTGMVAGGTAVVVASAGASETSSSSHSDETALTGTTLAKVKAAVLAEYRGATFERVETDSDGVYEAHITTADGDDLTVELDKSYAVTGTESRHGPGHGPGDGGHGPGHDGRGGGSGETPLTGATLAKVKAAVSVKYPGATFERVETDSDGVYEAHITTADGDDLTVELDKSYAITGTE